MIIKHYNSRTAQTENNSELELVKIELELKNTKAIAQVKSASIALNTALFVNNIHQVSPWTFVDGPLSADTRNLWATRDQAIFLGEPNSWRRFINM